MFLRSVVYPSTNTRAHIQKAKQEMENIRRDKSEQLREQEALRRSAAIERAEVNLCMSIYTHTHTHVHTQLRKHIACIHTHTHTHVHTHLSELTALRRSAELERAEINLCVYIYTHTHTHVHTQIRERAALHRSAALERAEVNLCVYVYTHT